MPIIIFACDYARIARWEETVLYSFMLKYYKHLLQKEHNKDGK